MKLEHIGIAVQSLAESSALFTKLIGVPPYKTEHVESEGVTTEFFLAGESKIELLESSREDSAIMKFLSAKGEGIHHLAFLVDDIEAEIARLKAEGFAFVADVPKLGADNKLVAFLHPKGTNRVLIELCQEKGA